jgi:Uma2 family endonuclease
MVRLLGNVIGARSCRVHTSGLRVFVESAGLATFPDASVICGPLKQHVPSPIATALNPAILVEVTSDSSEEYDTGAKLEYYRTIPSLREYVIVSHRARRIIVNAREEGGDWTSAVAAAGGQIAIPSLDAQLAVEDVYRNSAIR